MTNPPPEHASAAWSRFSTQMASLKFDARPAVALLHHLDDLSPLAHATRLLDIGCGAGAVFERLLDPAFGINLAPAAALLATDFSAALTDKVRALQQRMLVAAPGRGWERVAVATMDAMDLSSVASGSVSHVSANFVLFMVSDAAKALAEIRRVLAPGGVLALTSHEGNQWMECAAGYATNESEVLPPVWRSQEGVAAVLARAGFEEVGADAVPLEMPFERPEQVLEMLVAMPLVAAALAGFDEQRRVSARAEMRARIVDRGGEKGTLTGRGIVAWGRKGGQA